MISAEIIKKIMNVWANDSNIQSLCQALYGRRPLIRGFVDLEKPIPDENFPVIGFYGTKSEGGMNGHLVRHEFLVGFAVLDDEIDRDDALNIETSLGLSRLQTLRGMAEHALFTARLGKVTWEGEEDPLTDFPVFTAMTVITVEMQNTKPRRI
jgi:hypothetical protein